MQYTNLIWRDGQPYSEMFDDIYYSSNNHENISGEAEFNHVFFENNDLAKRWQHSNNFVIAELGLGSTLNCLLTIREWLKYCAASESNKTLHYIAIEKYPLSPAAISDLISRYPDLQPFCEELLVNYPPAIATTQTRYVFDNRVVLHFKFLDAYEALKDEYLNVDAWYLDGFSPAKNTEMWSEKLFSKIAQNSHRGSTCSTYTVAGQVRRNLQSSGFSVKKMAGYGKKREMLTAEYTALDDISFTFTDKPWFQPQLKPKVSEKNAMIIGAGIAGLSVAYALIKRGWTVTILDKHGGATREASSNPAAIVYPRLSINNDVDTEFYTAAYCYSVNFLKKLQLNYPQKFWFDCGLKQLLDRRRISEIIQKFEFNDEFISIVEDGCGSEGKIESIDNIDVADKKMACVKYESAGVVLPEVLIAALKQACANQLTIIKTDISEIKKESDQWQCYSDTELIDKAEILIIANGVAINDFSIMPKFPVESIRGQVLVLDENACSKKLKRAVNAEVYLTPSIYGKHYVGATYDRGSAETGVDINDNEKLISSVNKAYPDVFKASDYLEAWVGFRAMSKDRVAIVGAIPDEDFFNEEYEDICHGKKNKNYPAACYLKGLYISAAHGSRGFTSSYLCGEIIAAQIAGEPMPVSNRVLNYLSPSRFIVNKLKRR